MKIPAWMRKCYDIASSAWVGDTIQFHTSPRYEVTLKTAEQAQIWRDTQSPLMLMLKDFGPRYFRECYIDGEIHWVRSEGMMDLAHIFIEANGMRWAVLRDAQDDFLLTDLWETTTRDDNTIIDIGPVLKFTDLDAAIAAARLHI